MHNIDTSVVTWGALRPINKSDLGLCALPPQNATSPSVHELLKRFFYCCWLSQYVIRNQQHCIFYRLNTNHHVGNSYSSDYIAFILGRLQTIL